jgi:hypothetical protein
LHPKFFTEMRTVVLSSLLKNLLYHLFITFLQLGTFAAADISYQHQPCHG